MVSPPRVPRKGAKHHMSKIIRYPGFPEPFTFAASSARWTIAARLMRAAWNDAVGDSRFDDAAFFASPDDAKDPVRDGIQLTAWATKSELDLSIPDGFRVGVGAEAQPRWHEFVEALEQAEGISIRDE